MHIGIDTIEIERVQLKDGWIKRFLTKKEFLFFTNAKQNFSIQRQKEFLAGRWACKEAIIKLLRESIPLNRLEIINDNDNLYCVYGNKTIMLSLTHNKTITIAIAYSE